MERDILHRIAIIPGGIERPDKRAHAGADHEVRDDSPPIKLLYRRYVRKPPGAAAGEDKGEYRVIIRCEGWRSNGKHGQQQGNSLPDHESTFPMASLEPFTNEAASISLRMGGSTLLT